jgi:hypothetical protein
VANPVASSLRTYAARIASRTISTLQLVPDDEFARGIVEFKNFCEREDRGQPVHDEIDVFLFARPISPGPIASDDGRGAAYAVTPRPSHPGRAR